ncbi:hypothetical protein [Phenylobacterium sp.]|jgi:hypothetical protein|uniref:hypothetical protein n=1 Tax=Phenylobacterium sp. TaxID=1871053 RepID=UPI002F925460
MALSRLLPAIALALVAATAAPAQAPPIPSGYVRGEPLAKLSDRLLLWSDGRLATGRGRNQPPEERPRTELQRVTPLGPDVLACGLGEMTQTYFAKYGALTCVVATRTGRLRRLAVRTPKVAAVHDLRAGDGWATALVSEHGRGPAVIRFDPATGRRTARIRLKREEGERATPALLDANTVGRLVRRDGACLWTVTRLDGTPSPPPQALPQLPPGCGVYRDRLLVDAADQSRLLLLMTRDNRATGTAIATPATRPPYALRIVARRQPDPTNDSSRFVLWGDAIYVPDFSTATYSAYRLSDARLLRADGPLPMNWLAGVAVDPSGASRPTVVFRPKTGGWETQPFPPR